MYNFVEAPIPADCAQAYAGGDEWKCLWPSYRLPYVSTPYFLNAAQFDAFQIMYDTNNLDSTYCCNTPQQQQWADQFQTQTLQLLNGVPSTCGIYSSSCLVHCLSCNADWFTFQVDGQSLAHSVATWYFGQQKTDDISSCTGWDCTLQCSGGPWEPTNQPCTTTTNVCANDYYLTPSSVGEASGQVQPGQQQGGGHPDSQQTQAGIAAWNAQNLQNNQNAQSQFSSVSSVQTQGQQPGTVSATEPCLSAQQQAVLQCQTQVAAQQAKLAQMQSSDNAASSQISSQLASMQAQCAQMQAQAGGR